MRQNIRERFVRYLNILSMCLRVLYECEGVLVGGWGVLCAYLQKNMTVEEYYFILQYKYTKRGQNCCNVGKTVTAMRSFIFIVVDKVNSFDYNKSYIIKKLIRERAFIEWVNCDSGVIIWRIGSHAVTLFIIPHVISPIHARLVWINYYWRSSISYHFYYIASNPLFIGVASEFDVLSVYASDELPLWHLTQHMQLSMLQLNSVRKRMLYFETILIFVYTILILFFF